MFSFNSSYKYEVKSIEIVALYWVVYGSNLKAIF